MEAISKNMVDRLVCAKYLYNKGIELLDSESHFAGGLAVNHFQDAAELVLRVIAEHHHVSLKNNVRFNQIIDSIDEKADEIELNRITHRSSLNQLNKTRVNFKHFAIRPDLRDVRKFSQDLAEFFPIALKNFLSLDYEHLSLVQLINHTRTTNWLKKAEEFLNQSMYPEAAVASRIAFEIYRTYQPRRSLWEWRSRDRLERDLDRREVKDYTFFQLARNTDEELTKIKNHIDILFDGIDPTTYTKFISYTPEVIFNSDNDVWSPNIDEEKGVSEGQLQNLPDLTPSLTNFCFRFAVDSILKLQESLVPPSAPYSSPTIEYEVIKDTVIYVSPQKKEILKEVKEGARVFSYSITSKVDTDEMKSIYEENMTAYIAKSYIRKT